MPALDEIPGIGKASLDLLEAVGITNAEELASQRAETLARELGHAIDTLGINKRPPGLDTVGKWIAHARELTGITPEPDHAQAEDEIRAPVNHEDDPEIAAMLSRAPFAIPLPGKTMMENGLAVSDVAAGLLLNHYSGDLEVRVGEESFSGNVETIEKGVTPMIPSPRGGRKLPKSRPRRGEEDGRVSTTRTPSEQVNRGKDPASRRFVRGVLHTHPWRVRIGAFFSLLLMANLPVSIVSAVLLLLSRENPESFSWVPQWVLIFPIALPLVGLGFFIWTYPVKCRICTQKLFVHNRARKHIKSHHFPGLGYVVPLCTHLLLFSWFRCCSCGTPVRLKK